MYSEAVGELSVRIARDTAEAFVEGRPARRFETPPPLREKAGAFVTINTWPAEALRACIGYAHPVFPLVEALVKAARGACEDPRFPALAAEELPNVVVETSLLTPPEALSENKPRKLGKLVRVGTDGLIAVRGQATGLILPQVAVQEGWGAEEFLSQACMKAELLPDAWLDGETRIYRFQAEVFGETRPRGPVVRRDLGAEHAGR